LRPETEHQHAPIRAVEVCACGATRAAGGDWVTLGQAFAETRLNLTPEERSERARAAANARWKGTTEGERREVMQGVARHPRPSRVLERCPCGKYTKRRADQEGHTCSGQGDESGARG
jgi:hypothetical protein